MTSFLFAIALLIGAGIGAVILILDILGVFGQD